jgi:hypothetical protein
MSTQYIRLSQNIRQLERIIAALRLNTRKDRYNRGLIAGIELALDCFSGKTSSMFLHPNMTAKPDSIDASKERVDGSDMNNNS